MRSAPMSAEGMASSISSAHEEILSHYGAAVRMSGRLPDALSVAMGNQFYMATFPEMAEVEAFFAAVSALV